MEKKKLLRIILTAVLLVGAVIIEKTLNLEVWQLLLVYLVPFLLIGYDTIGEAVEGIMHGEVFDEDFLMPVRFARQRYSGFFAIRLQMSPMQLESPGLSDILVI